MNHIVLSVLLTSCMFLNIQATFICKGMVRLKLSYKSEEKPNRVSFVWHGQSNHFPVYVYIQRPGDDNLKPEHFIADGVWNQNEISFSIPQHQLLRSKPLYIYFYVYVQNDAEYVPQGILTLSTRSQQYFEFVPFN